MKQQRNAKKSFVIANQRRIVSKEALLLIAFFKNSQIKAKNSSVLSELLQNSLFAK